MVRESNRNDRPDRRDESEKLRLLRKEIALGLEAAEAGRFSDRSIAEIAQSVLDEADD
jgi:hypothetical protein